MIVLVCGGRGWVKPGPIHALLAGLFAEHHANDPLTVIEGGARGADRIAGQWAAKKRAVGVGWVRFPAQWDDYAPSEKWRAGRDRNTDMLHYLDQGREIGQRTLVLAFKDGFNHRMDRGGTEHMVSIALNAKHPVYLICQPQAA